MICNKCNHKLPDDSEFCQYCGNRIEKEEEVQQVDTIEEVKDEIVSSEEHTETPEIDLPNLENTTPEEALKTILKIQAEQTLKNLEKNMHSQPSNEGEADFGLVPEKPIYTLALKSVDGEREYLNRLYTENGVKVKWERQGSTSAEGISGMIDIYNTYLPTGEFYKTIYINMYGAKASQGVPKGFAFVKPEEKRTNPSNIIRNTPKTKSKKKNTLIPFANISAIILSALSILITICLMSIENEINDFIIYKSILLIAYTIFLVFAIISLLKKRFKLLTWLSFTLPWIVGILEFYVAWEYRYYAPYDDDVIIWSNICFTATIIIFAIMLFPTSVAIANAIKNSWHQSVRYHEKCYKRIAKMHTYLEKGIISQEEFERVRSKILKNIE